MSSYKLVAMIPARLGSKRIPMKNVRYLLDKPLIQYPIDLALACGAFESVWVNTESEALGAVAQSMGARFHRRPPELAVDTATNREFTYEFMRAHPCDYVVMINTTSPALRLETLQSFVSFLQNDDYDTIMSVISVQAEAFHKGNAINFDTSKPKINSQLLAPVQEIMWAITAWKCSSFMRTEEEGNSPVFGGKLGLFTIPKDESADLDTEEDWNIAEGILSARMRREEVDKRYLEI